MITKPNFLSIKTIKQLLPRMLLVVGLACTVLVSIPTWSSADSPVVSEVVKDGNGNPIGIQTTTTHGSGGTKTVDTVYTSGPNAGVHQVYNEDAKNNTISSIITSPDGTRTDYTKNALGGFDTRTARPNGIVETETADAANHTISRNTTYPNGTVVNATFDPKNPNGHPTALTITDAKGNTTTAQPDGKPGLGGFTSTVKDKHGQVATTSYDTNGRIAGETIQDKHGKVVSSTSFDDTGKVVSQTGKPKTMSLGTSGQSTSGMQTSQGSGKHKEKKHFQTQALQPDKHNFQNEFFHQNKEKSHDQEWSSSSGSSGSSGSGQSHHHGRR
jgi:YD repeat-containing protein